MVRFPMPKTGWKRQGVARWLPVAKFTISKRAAGMKKILLVEDNPGDADLARLAFETAEIDCEIRLAESGEKALEIATEFPNHSPAITPRRSEPNCDHEFVPESNPYTATYPGMS